MQRNALLVELVTEELPPKALAKLGEMFARGVVERLRTADLVTEDAAWRWFASPRRLAVWVEAVAAKGADREQQVRLMPVTVAYDSDGQPTTALVKRLAAKGLTPGEAPLFRAHDGKQEQLFLRETVPGADLFAQLAEWVHAALDALPIPKRMRWGSGDETFVRPVHRLVMLWGDQVVPGTVLGLESGRETLGHRFLSRGAIPLAHADAYEPTLLAEGKVIPDFAARREAIAKMLAEAAQKAGAHLRDDPDLLDEVTALVEYPAVYLGTFPEAFLAVPPECLILTMRANQKYFPLFDAADRLTNRFLIVSNMRIAYRARSSTVTNGWCAPVWPMRSSSSNKTAKRRWSVACLGLRRSSITTASGHWRSGWHVSNPWRAKSPIVWASIPFCRNARRGSPSATSSPKWWANSPNCKG